MFPDFRLASRAFFSIPPRPPPVLQTGVVFDRENLRPLLARLAGQGAFLGTSSWKYPGWRGMLYDEARYVWRGRYSRARFEKLCLAEYAEVFKTVSVDAAYYRFPDRRFVEELVSLVPADFLFALKVTDEITIKRFPNLPRFGSRAGQPNCNFLNADLFASAFLAPCEPFRANLGLLLFEFSRFRPDDFAQGRDFVGALDQFLARLPRGWRYGVEIRNRAFLHPDYFALLARHHVAHIFNNWQDMPPVQEQLALPGSRTASEFLGARFLLAPGRKYEEAVRAFSPYDRVQEVNEAGRAAGAQLIRDVLGSGVPTKAFIYVNNRFEGNALHTVAAMLARAQVTSQ
jgi:uncharacterized protein YecE (DUF72 family)